MQLSPRTVLTCGTVLMSMPVIVQAATTPIAYERAISARCEVQEDPTGSRVIDEDYVILPHAGILDDDRDAMIVMGGSVSESFASQLSSMSSSQFSIEGAISGSSDNSGGLFICQASPVSRAVYMFSVDEVTPYHIEGTLDATGGGVVVCRFDAMFGGETIFVEFNPGESTFIEYSGELQPGSYRLRVEASAYISSGSVQSAAFSLAGTFGAVPVQCLGDASGNSTVDFEDLDLVLTNWGTTNAAADMDDSGTVDFGDLNLVLGHWGMVCTD